MAPLSRIAGSLAAPTRIGGQGYDETDPGSQYLRARSYIESRIRNIKLDPMAAQYMRGNLFDDLA
jgi:hypothetical protein